MFKSDRSDTSREGQSGSPPDPAQTHHSLSNAHSVQLASLQNTLAITVLGDEGVQHDQIARAVQLLAVTNRQALRAGVVAALGRMGWIGW